MIGGRLHRRIAAVLFLCVFLPAQALRPERKVLKNVITSDRDPEVRIHLPDAARYMGADRWTLYDVADCEVHAFVEADAHSNVQRLYWLQFEGYVPSKPEARYDYDSARHMNIGGMDFFVDTWVRGKDGEVRSGSDREHIETLIRGKGYHMPAGMMYVRLVHLLDDQRRKELMIIYGEEVGPSGLSAADLQPGGKAHDQWPALESGLIERAREKITIDSRGK